MVGDSGGSNGDGADAGSAGLHPYVGQRRAEHFNPGEVGQRTIAEYGDDGTRAKRYTFNAAGFRGEDFDPRAKKRIVVCGCSLTFGVGLDLEETWSHRFRQLYAEALGLQHADVNLLNFSQGGCSNDYITRTLLSQAAMPNPDLAIVHFTFANRAEGLVGEQPFDIGPWLLEDALNERIAWGERIQGYYLYHSDELGVANALRNMLLLQYHYQRAGVPYAFAWVDRWLLEEPAFRGNAVLSPLIDLLDRSKLAPFALPGAKLDLAADGAHPGPRSNEAFAEKLLAFCRSIGAIPGAGPAVTPAVPEHQALRRAPPTPGVPRG